MVEGEDHDHGDDQQELAREALDRHGYHARVADRGQHWWTSTSAHLMVIPDGQFPGNIK